MEPGRITEQMYTSLLTEDFSIAVLTFHNPNVFYEVAIAQSAGKPVIMMIEKGSSIPFDLHNIRVIEYDLKPTPIFEGAYVKQLTQMIQNLKQAGLKPNVPFGINLSPLAAKNSEFNLNVPAEKYFRYDDWMQIINSANSKFHIAGYGLTGWPAFPGIKETLLNAAQRGCEIKILTYSSENPAFSNVQNFEILATDVSSQGTQFETVRNFFHEILGNIQGCEVRALRNGVLFQQIVFSDDELILLPYMYSINSEHGPVIRCKSSFPLYDTARYEFDTLWDLNEPQNKLISRVG